MARPGNVDSSCGCLILLVVLLGAIGFAFAVFDDEASEPSPQPGPPTLNKAIVQVTGDDGGTYDLSWTVWTPEGEVLSENKVSNVISSEPRDYQVDLTGFKSDKNSFFLGTEDIDVEASKQQAWEGDLTIILEVNGEIVACSTMNSYDTAIISFDADKPEQYEGNLGCKLQLWLF